MEEILASIRRIIAEDDSGRPIPAPPRTAAAQEPAAAAPAESPDDIDDRVDGFDDPQTPSVAANDVFDMSGSHPPGVSRANAEAAAPEPPKPDLVAEAIRAPQPPESKPERATAARIEPAWPGAARPSATEPPRPAAIRFERSKPSAAKPEAEDSESARFESAWPEPARPEPGRVQPPRFDLPRSDLPRSEPPQSNSARIESARADSTRADSARADAAWSELARAESARLEAARVEMARAEMARAEMARAEASRVESVRPEPARFEPARSEQPYEESDRPQPARPEPATSEAVRARSNGVPATPPAMLRPSGDAGLLSPRTSAAVDLAFNTLAQTVLVQNSRTLDDLVREMLKPMLKAWLDDNLPNLVERLVRAEIERVSRGRS